MLEFSTHTVDLPASYTLSCVSIVLHTIKIQRIPTPPSMWGQFSVEILLQQGNFPRHRLTQAFLVYPTMRNIARVFSKVFCIFLRCKIPCFQRLESPFQAHTFQCFYESGTSRQACPKLFFIFSEFLFLGRYVFKEKNTHVQLASELDFGDASCRIPHSERQWFIFTVSREFTKSGIFTYHFVKNSVVFQNFVVICYETE